MEVAIKSFFFGLNPKVITFKQNVDVIVSNPSHKKFCLSTQKGCNGRCLRRRENQGHCSAVSAVVSGLEDVDISSSSPFEDFTISTSGAEETGELKINIDVFGAKTRAIFDEVFDKMVAAAQPIPGFRRVKGGKTPNIPRDILLEVLGPSKVYKQVIKKVINSVVAEYVEKEDLKVSTDLRVEQSYEDLEDAFEPGEKFSFDAVIQLQEHA